jgi:hypothetical protein
MEHVGEYVCSSASSVWPGSNLAKHPDYPLNRHLTLSKHMQPENSRCILTAANTASVYNRRKFLPFIAVMRPARLGRGFADSATF